VVLLFFGFCFQIFLKQKKIEKKEEEE